MKQSSSFIAVFQRVFKWLTAFRHTRTILRLPCNRKTAIVSYKNSRPSKSVAPYTIQKELKLLWKVPTITGNI